MPTHKRCRQSRLKNVVKAIRRLHSLVEVRNFYAFIRINCDKLKTTRVDNFSGYELLETLN